ncbi:MAG: hypothetical protein CMC04_00205 [Flavobacteriaceae bacterium]|jgi:uncharacterized membrane protein|nr:hypothetical protein [Flavobacteriaceae bacterium]|tara:strand:- start:4482 stop:4913 length:432 start_codon:yes stop_codon:yes gene_type:complete
MVKNNVIKKILRISLGIGMLYIGVGHLTFSRLEFQAQVPMWLAKEKSLIDFVVITSGIIEILLGVLMSWGGKFKAYVGFALAIFYILIFPGNISQYINEIDAFGLNTPNKRLTRLLFQPLLIIWALWSTEGLHFFKKVKNSVK